MRNFITYITAILIILLFSGCTNNTNSEISSHAYVESDNSEVTSSEIVTSESTTTSQATTAVTTTTSTTVATTTTIATTKSTTAKPVTTTKPTVTTTKAPATTTKPPVTTAAPAVVVIPNVLVPTSPGSEIYSTTLATIDVSNKSSGYFTAKYTGSSSTVKMLVTKDGVKYTYSLNSSGQTEVFPLQMGSGNYNIFIGELVSGTSYSMAIQQDISVSISNSNSVFLYPNQQVNFNQGSNAVNKSAEVCAGKTTDLEKIGAIFTYVTSNIVYDKNLAQQVTSGAIKSYTPYPDETLRTKKGICYDYAALFAAMTRAQGIPTKLVMGYATPDSLYHAWNEVYTVITSYSIHYTKLYETVNKTRYGQRKRRWPCQRSSTVFTEQRQA